MTLEHNQRILWKEITPTKTNSWSTTWWDSTSIEPFRISVVRFDTYIDINTYKNIIMFRNSNVDLTTGHSTFSNGQGMLYISIKQCLYYFTLKTTFIIPEPQIIWILNGYQKANMISFYSRSP